MTNTFEDLGPNSGLVDEMYRQYQADPSSVSPAWQDFFSDYLPTGTAPSTTNGGAATPVATAPVTPSVPSMTIRQEPPAEPKRVSETAPLMLDGDEPKPIRGAAARIVENMEASLGVPTATSVRNVPAKLLEVNRQILNNHLSRTGRGKVSFTHLIAYAAVQAVRRVPRWRPDTASSTAAPSSSATTT